MKKLFLLIGALAVIIATIYIHTPAVSTDSTSSTTLTTRSSPQATEHAMFKVGDKTYALNVKPDETVMSAMNALSPASGFTYTSRDYPGLGEFVDSINGRKNADGRYWILYVNGVSVMSGASTAIITAGDVIEWKYEKSF